MMNERLAYLSLAAASLLLSHCAAIAPYAPVAQAALETFTELLKQHGSEDVVISCEHEVHPAKNGEWGFVLMPTSLRDSFVKEYLWVPNLDK